jgi:pyruvate formate lyase activating enzyme
MKQAVLFEKRADKSVKCTACSHYCLIALNRRGACGVRKNVDGKLWLLVYGKAAALNVDPVEKKPLFHFLPNTQILSLGTLGCNFGCEFCQN